MNAQKKVIDVWLIYRCCLCNTTWNRPILSRCSVTDIEDESFDAFERNDGPTARRYAFDIASLRSLVMRVELDERLRIERTQSAELSPRGYTINLAIPFRCDLRLERLLATELAISRASLRERHAAGTLVVSPERREPLRKPIHDGQEICFVQT